MMLPKGIAYLALFIVNLFLQEDLKPYIDHVIECFSFERVVYGGDWFVSTLATSYPGWVEALDWAVEGSSEEELRKLYSDNAEAVYRLKS